MTITSASKTQAYPPVANTCPDNWVVDGSWCVVPANSSNLGTLMLNPANLSSTPGYSSTCNGHTTGCIKMNDLGWSSGETSVCAKKNWANMYNIQWDGIGNYNSC